MAKEQEVNYWDEVQKRHATPSKVDGSLPDPKKLPKNDKPYKRSPEYNPQHATGIYVRG